MISIALVNVGTEPSVDDHLTGVGIFMPDPLTYVLYETTNTIQLSRFNLAAVFDAGSFQKEPGYFYRYILTQPRGKQELEPLHL